MEIEFPPKDADIGVRRLRPGQAALVARRLGTFGVGLYAHRHYLKQHGTPRTVAELQQQALIGFDRELPALREMRHGARGGEMCDHDRFALRTDSGLIRLAAIRAGMVWASTNTHLRGVTGWSGYFRTHALDMEIWLVMHEDLRADRRVRLVYDYLAKALAAFATGN